MERLFRYEQVATKIENIIAINNLRPGDKIPSVRTLVKELGVSLSTVVQAYTILEAKGILFPKPKTGYFVNSAQHNKLLPAQKLAQDQVPGKVEINNMVVKMLKDEKFIKVNFATMAPGPELMPITKINKALLISSKDPLSTHFHYPYLEGHPRLQKQIARHTIGWKNSLPDDSVLITNGCLEAINLCLDALTKPGDIVAIEAPTYPGILQCIENRGLRIYKIAVNPDTGLDIDQLETALENTPIVACIFSPTCHNPTGSSVPENNLIRLVNLLGERNIPLIEDDALGELFFGAVRSKPAKAYDSYNNVLYCSSFSKTLTPGFRIGWVSGGKYHKKLEKVKFATNMSTNTLLQDAIGRYLEGGDYHNHIKKLKKAVENQVMKYRYAITGYFPPETKISLPKGGYSLWIELPNQISGTILQNMAMQKGIGFTPGQISSTYNSFHQYIRINCCMLFNSKTDAALRELGDMVYSLL